MWERVCANAAPGATRRDEELQLRFLELAARMAARGGRLHPDVGRLTRVGTEIDGDSPDPWGSDEWRPRTPGRDTLVLAEARRWTRMEVATAATRSDELPFRAEMERRFGERLDEVTVATAAALPRGAIAAAAHDRITFTEPSPTRETVAHEVAHVLQYRRGRPRTNATLGEPGDPAEREAERAAGEILAGRSVRINQTPMARMHLQQPPVGPAPQAPPPQLVTPPPAFPVVAPPTARPAPRRPRGPNPSAGITPLIAQARTDPEALLDPATYARSFVATMVADLRSAAPASGARFGTEIVEAVAAGLSRDLDHLETWWSTLTHPRAADRRHYRDALLSLAATRQAEVDVAFRYDVVFVADSPGISWAASPADWAEIDTALAAIPDEFLWDRPTGILRLERGAIGPSSALGVTAGETLDGNTVRVFSAGLGAAPIARSAGIRDLSATSQTIRHEFGHLVQSYMRTGAVDELFSLIQWDRFGWSWGYQHWQTGATPPACPLDTPAMNARCLVCDAAGFTSDAGRDWDALDRFLAGLTARPTTHNGREWTHPPGGFWINSWRSGAVPSGPQWAYAATDRADYFSELFAFAISDPGFVHDQVPPDQIEWLKRAIFSTRAEIDAAIADNTLAINSAAADRFQAQAPRRVERLFTRRQIRDALQALVTELMTSDAVDHGPVG